MLIDAVPRGQGEGDGLKEGNWAEMNELPLRRPQSDIRRPSSIRSGSASGSNSRNGSMRPPRTPRTPNMKVRFDLPERASKSLDGKDVVIDGVQRTGNGSSNGGLRSLGSGSMWDADEHLQDDMERNEVRNYTRESIDDPMDDEHGDDQYNAPLLPSASGAIISSLELDNPLDCKTSSLQAAISNMSNSIDRKSVV